MSTETTYSGYPPTRPLTELPWPAAGHAMRRLLKPMVRRYIRRHTMDELARLPDFVLNDIGVHPGDIRRMADELAREHADAWVRRARTADGFGD